MRRLRSNSLWSMMVVLAAGVILLCGQSAFADYPDCEVRSTWLKSEAMSSDWANTIAKYEQGNLNDVMALAPEINGNMPWSYTDPADFQQVIDDSHARGWAVHGWICNALRKKYQKWVDFRDAGEPAAQAQWVRDLFTQYPDLDGVHLDYIRYDKWGDGVNGGGRMDAVTATVQAISDVITNEFPGKKLSAAIMRIDYG